MTKNISIPGWLTMCDKDTNVPNKTDFISREAAFQAIEDIDENAGARGSGFTDSERIMRDSAFYALEAIKPADVVSRDCYDRILAENDTMRKMLAQIGKKPGDKMDDVRIAKKGEWIRGRESVTGPGKDSYTCSVCGEKTLSGFCGNPAKTNFCPNCGADMRETGR